MSPIALPIATLDEDANDAEEHIEEDIVGGEITPGQHVQSKPAHSVGSAVRQRMNEREEFGMGV